MCRTSRSHLGNRVRVTSSTTLRRHPGRPPLPHSGVSTPLGGAEHNPPTAVNGAQSLNPQRHDLLPIFFPMLPPVLLTAGHCTDGTAVARVWFAEDVQNNREYPFGGATSYEGIPYTNPDFCIGCGNGLPGFAQRDVGIIVLTEPVPTSVVSEYAQLPSVGLVDELSSK